MRDHAYYMEIALTQAEAALRIGETPIGAVVVSADGDLIGYGYNTREIRKDPTAHAEMTALQDAARRIGDWRLSRCILYVTLEPCIMCAGAIQQSRIAHVVFGASSPKGGALGSCGFVYDMANLNHYPEVTAGVLGDKCAMILADFFRAKRGASSAE